MSKDSYIFPTVVEKSEDGGIGLYFPDVPGTAVLSPDIHTAIAYAKSMLIDRIIEMEYKNMEIPVPSDPDDIELNSTSDRIVYVEVFLPPYRDAAANKSVTVNCTLPQWLRDAGKEADLNFSHLLKNSLKDALEIK